MSYTDPSGETTWSGNLPADFASQAGKDRLIGEIDSRIKKYLKANLIAYVPGGGWMSLASRVDSYRTRLDMMTINFVDRVAANALGQMTKGGVWTTIDVSATQYEKAAKENKKGAFYELAATVLHELAHSFQDSGYEPDVDTSTSSLYNLNAKRVNGKSLQDGVSDYQSKTFPGVAAPTESSVKREPYAYWREAMAFNDVYADRKKLSIFNNVVDPWGSIYKVSFNSPSFNWKDATWRYWTLDRKWYWFDSFDEANKVPPGNMLQLTQY